MLSQRMFARGAVGLLMAAAFSLATLPNASASQDTAVPLADTFSGTASFDVPVVAGPYTTPAQHTSIVLTFTENPLATFVSVEACGTGESLGNAHFSGRDTTPTEVAHVHDAGTCFNLRVRSNVPQANPFKVAGTVTYAS